MVLGTWLSYFNGLVTENQEDLPNKTNGQVLNEYVFLNQDGESTIVNSNKVETMKVGKVRINKKKKKSKKMNKQNLLKLLMEEKDERMVKSNHPNRNTINKNSNLLNKLCNSNNNKIMRKNGQIKQCEGSVQSILNNRP